MNYKINHDQLLDDDIEFIYFSVIISSDSSQIFDGILYKDINFGYELLPSTENLYWHRVKNLWKIYQSITDDLVYKAMWERKLKELMQRGFNGQ